MLQEERLRSVLAQDESCLDGETEPDERLDGDGGVGDILACGCHGALPGGDNVTGTTLFTTTQISGRNSTIHTKILRLVCIEWMK